jgi:hypothetical protein
MLWQLITMWLSASAPATITETWQWCDGWPASGPCQNANTQTVSVTLQSWLPRSSLVRIQAAGRVLCSMARDGVITCGPDVTAEDVARAWVCSVSPKLPGCKP